MCGVQGAGENAHVQGAVVGAIPAGAGVRDVLLARCCFVVSCVRRAALDWRTLFVGVAALKVEAGRDRARPREADRRIAAEA